MKTSRIIFLLILMVSCEGKTSRKSVPVINLKDQMEARDVNVSDLLKDICIVRLETSDSIMLGQNTNYLVGEKYIISIDNNKILQFSSEGKFLKTLAKTGKGPDEFLRADAFAMDEANDILYLNHRGDYHNIIIYDLKSGERTGRFSTGVDNLISGIIVQKDSVLAIVPRMNKDYNLYYLTTSGRVLNGIAPPAVKGIGLETSIVKVSGKMYYMPKEYDTLYLVKDTLTNASCFFDVEDRFTFENNETGNFVYLSATAPGFLIANKVHARIKMNDDGTFGMNADKITRYFINRKNFSVHEIKGFHNDFLGIEKEQNQWDDYLFVNNDLGFICYSSFDLKKMIDEALDSGKLEETVKLRISTLDKLIDENDNPVLVVGKLKQNL